MPTRHSTRSASAVAAVAYIRRSTSKQEKSLEDQCREIKQYAVKLTHRGFATAPGDRDLGVQANLLAR
jgi:hypothetical protein